MRYAALFAASLVFIVLGHFHSQRKKQEKLESREFKAAAARAEQREDTRQ